MKAEKIKNRIKECVTLFGFEYNGKEGNVDPYYIPTKKSYEFLLCFDGNEQTVYDIEAVMTTPFINGKTLNEVCNKIVITDW
jgi:hypothetical protein